MEFLDLGRVELSPQFCESLCWKDALMHFKERLDFAILPVLSDEHPKRFPLSKESAGIGKGHDIGAGSLDTRGQAATGPIEARLDVESRCGRATGIGRPREQAAPLYLIFETFSVLLITRQSSIASYVETSSPFPMLGFPAVRHLTGVQSIERSRENTASDPMFERMK